MTDSREITAETMAGRLDCLAGIAQPSADGFTYLNDDARKLLQDTARYIERSATPPASGLLAGVPEGWQLSPQDATDEMMEAGNRVCRGNCDLGGQMHHVWAAMSAARPSPSVPAQDAEEEAMRDESELGPTLISATIRQREEQRAEKNEAYRQRNHLVAALARLFPSGIRATNIEGWSPDWHGCVYIDLPSGQISYHYHDDHAHLFADLPAYEGPWDGHDKETAHARLATLSHHAPAPGRLAARAEKVNETISGWSPEKRDYAERLVAAPGQAGEDRDKELEAEFQQSEEIEFPLGMEDVRRALSNSRRLIEVACATIGQQEAALVELRGALASQPRPSADRVAQVIADLEAEMKDADHASIRHQDESEARYYRGKCNGLKFAIQTVAALQSPARSGEGGQE